MASYEGEPIWRSQVYGQLMCVGSHNDCEPEWGASLWDRIGRLSSTDTLHWEYTNDEQNQRYRFEMTDLPKTIEVIQVTPVLSTEQDQVITFKELPEKDTLKLELIMIPKSELTRQRDIPFVNHGRVFFARLIHEPGQVTLSREELIEFKGYDNGWSYPTADDTVFWNVASIRKVVKVVDGKNIQITYQRNHFVPIQLE